MGPKGYKARKTYELKCWRCGRSVERKARVKTPICIYCVRDRERARSQGREFPRHPGNHVPGGFYVAVSDPLGMTSDLVVWNSIELTNILANDELPIGTIFEHDDGRIFELGVYGIEELKS